VPKFGLDPCGLRNSQRQCHGDLRFAQPDQMRTGRRRPKGAQRRGGVPALVVMVEMHRARDTDLGFDAHGIGGHHRRAAMPLGLGQRKNRGQDGRGLMAAKDTGKIIIIKRMGRCAIHQRSIEHRYPAPPPDQRARPRRIGHTRHGAQCLDTVHACAGQRHGDGIDHPDPPAHPGLGRQITGAKGMDARGKCLGDRGGFCHRGMSEGQRG
jgi:hypothetical protein